MDAKGNSALDANATGASNTAVGRHALRDSTTGAGSVAVGRSALRSSTTGSNTAVGANALINLTTGTGNLALGHSTGVSQTTGSNNLYLDHGGVAGESDRIRIGDTQSEAYIAGNLSIGGAVPVRPLTVGDSSGGDTLGLLSSQGGSDDHLDFGADALEFVETGVAGARLVLRDGGNAGIGTGAPVFKLEVNGSAGKPGGGSWSVSSDARLKKNVHDLEGALETLFALRGVTFEYRDPAAVHELPGERIGFIAQEVEAVLPDWVEEVGGYRRLTVRGFEALAAVEARLQALETPAACRAH